MSQALTPVTPDPLSLVASALQAQVAALFPPASFELRTVPAALTLKVWTELMRRGPFVGLGWNGFEVTGPSPNGGGVSGTARFSLFLAVKNTLVASRYFGDANGLGLFSMVSVAAAGRGRWKMPGVGTVLVQKIEHGALDGGDESMAMAVLDLEVMGVVLDIGGAISGFTLGEFQQLAATYTSAATGETLVADNYAVGNWS
jgi:hypothetical protein